MKLIYCLMILLWPFISREQTVRPLNIGDTVPNIEINSIINYKTKTANLSDFKGDLILLDFWSTWCSACIAGFSKMDSLKREFKQLQILLVNAKSKTTNDNESKILNTLSRLKQRTGNDILLPVVYNNTRLDALFPVLYIPQVIWISNNKVVAITGADQVTFKNISDVLNGHQLSVHMKQDLLSYDSKTPLFINNNAGNGSQLLFRSMVTKYIEGVGRGSGFRVENNKIIGFYLLNHSLLNLIKNAYPEMMALPDNRICIESSNPNLNVKDNELSKYQFSFCYELVIPPSTEKQVREYMRTDLKKYFRVTEQKETRLMKCLVLRPRGGLLPPNKKEAGNNFDLEKDSKKKYIYNQPVSFALQLLNEYSSLPIIDETGIKTNISIDLPFDLTDVKTLQQAFWKSGFDLREEKKEIEVEVISDL